MLGLLKEIKNHPRGLLTLFLTELWERFSYYGMRAILVLYLVSEHNHSNPGLGWSNSEAIKLYGWYTALVYLACIPGGIIGDKFLNNRDAVSVGGALLCIGHLSLAIQNQSFFFVGLILIITGVGLLKPNISTLVGQLYKENDNRRDQGFTIFYIGINFGAFFSSLIVGYVGEVYGWHYGFSLAGFGMLIGQYFFLKGKENFNEIKIKNKSSMLSFSFSSIEKDRIKLILISSFILIIFWASFEQAGGLMNIYAFEKTDRYLEIINFEVPASWFQSINPLMIIIFGFYVSAFWIFLRKKNIISSSLFKISVGIIIMGLGFVFMYFASRESSLLGKSSMHWLVLAYLFHTIGELCASPVILSYITKLSPRQLVASVMGIYFATIGLGNKLAGTIGENSANFGETIIFLGITILCLTVGLSVIFFHKKLIKLSHGIDS
ncbi:MAG: peptide MFS transporter [Pseudomonadota bacterium]|nr:peptide MFS transporter [Pseudomonadota bacterium]